MAKKYYGLIKWVGGTDDKTYTAGIPTEWIVGFDYDLYTNDDHDPMETYVIEWRSTKRKPKGGWKCYDGHVILVSHRIAKLENHLKILDGVKSPKEITAGSKEVGIDNNTRSRKELFEKAGTSGSSLATSQRDRDGNTSKKPSTKSSGDSPRRKIQMKPPQKRRLLDSDTDVSEVEVEPSSISGIGVFPSGYSKASSEHMSSDDEFNTVDAVEVQKKNQEQPTLQDVMDGIIRIENIVKTLQIDITNPNGKSTTSKVPLRRPNYGAHMKNADLLGDGEFTEGNVEIGPPGSGISVTDMQWTAAVSKGTYKAMATTLLMSVFPLDVLLRSNLKGGVSKQRAASGEASRPKHEALDDRLLSAIKHSVQSVYPKTYTDAGVGQAINAKLTNLRNRPNQKADSDD